MRRLTALFILAGTGFALSPATASAQFGYGFPRYNVGPTFVPSFNPFFAAPYFRYQQSYGLSLPGPYGNLSFRSQYSSFGYFNPANTLLPVVPTFYSQSGSYMSGSARPNFALETQRDIQRAQRAGGMQGPNEAPARRVGANVAAPALTTERASGAPEVPGQPLAPVDRAKVLSGEALNNLLGAVAKAEQRNVDRPAAFVSPLQLEEVRFGGSDAAAALNAAVRPLDFPAAFDDPALKDLRLALARDFAPIAAALQAGKNPEPAKLGSFETTLAKVEAALPPVVRDLPFADSTAVRLFMNQLAATVKAVKDGAGNGLVDPKWVVEGTTVAELARHMTRHKLRFAAAPAGHEETYASLHRNLAAYLQLLTEAKK